MLLVKTTTRRSTRRAGAVLLVVLAMLALFAIVGLSFVFYAESRATSSRIYRESQSTNEEDLDAQREVMGAMAQLIFDVPDGRTGVFSGLRGHSLARAMYGQYYETAPPQAGVFDLDNSIIQFTTNSLAYNGVGPVPGHVVPPGAPGTPGQTPVVNYTWRFGQPLLDPERTSNLGDNTSYRNLPTEAHRAQSRYFSKAVSSTYPDANDMAIAMVNPVNGQVLAPSLHRAYVFNAQFANLTNEYRRQQALSPPDSPVKQALGFSSAIDDWVTQAGRYRMIRPRPIDHMIGGVSQFPYPPMNADGTFTGDVQNLPGAVYPYLDPATGAPAPGGLLIPKNDSVWVDIGAPVRIWNGKRVKPLFAFLVTPTNNKVNVNASGNTRGLTVGPVPPDPSATAEQIHTSGMGLNASEINPMRILRQNTGTVIREYERIKFNQYGAANQPNYVAGGQLNATGAPLPNPPGRTQPTTLFKATLPPSAYAPLDWDGGAPFGAMRMQLPGQEGTFPGQLNAGATLGNSAYALAPRWNAPTGFSRYSNGDIGDATPVEQTESPYLWNPFLWRTTGTVGRMYSDSDIRKLHQKWADDTGVSNDTELGRLAPISFGSIRGVPSLSTSPSKSPSNAARFSITNRSNGLAIHNLMPMHVNLGNGGVTPSYTTPLPYTWMPGAPVPVGMGGPPTNPGAGPYPDPAAGGYGPQTTTDFDYSQLNNNGGAGALSLIRGVTSNLPPLDLNRPMADYRHALAIRYGRPLRPDNIILPKTALELSNWYANNQVTAAERTQLDVAPVRDTDIVAASGAFDSLYAAMRDRQEMAKDVFARLVIATGAAGSYMKWNGYMQPLVPPTVAPGATPNPQFDALRYLAQLSANIVDYIDGDDVATTFVWNPIDPNVPSEFRTPTEPGLLANPLNFTAAEVPNRLVMGTEKPKLVVNEAYGELTNNQKDTMGPAANPLEVRFIVELMNPNANDIPNGSETKPFTTATNPMQNAWLFYGPSQQTISVGNYSAYLVDVHQDGINTTPALAARNNVLGLPPAAPDLRIDFAEIYNRASTGPNSGYASAGVRTQPNLPPLYPNTLASPGINNVTPQQVGPVGMKYRPDVWTMPSANPVNQGYLVLAPGETQSVPQEYTPAPWDGMGAYTVTPGSPFEYATMVPRPTVLPTPGVPAMSLALEVGVGRPAPSEADIIPQLQAIQAAQPTVILRRLANPYFRPNDPTILTGSFPYDATLAPNPYLAVDRMENVWVNDGVRAGSDVIPMDRPNRNGSQFPTPINERHSTTKMHPLASHVNFNKSLQVTPPPTATPHEAFFRHNGQTVTGDPETTLPANSPTAVRSAVPASGQLGSDPNLLMTPQGGGRAGFEWLVHLDRPLVNQLELLHVPATAPHQLTQQFAQGDISSLATIPSTVQPSYRFHSHVAAWTDSSIGNINAPIANFANQARLYRALELLKVKPWSYAMPIGGRVPGKININMVTDPNVLLALADPQSGDFFKAVPTDPTPGDPTNTYAFDALYDPADPLDTLPAKMTNPLLQTTYAKLMKNRAGTTPVTSAQYNPATNQIVTTVVPGATDKPFRSLGNAYTTVGAPPFAVPAKNGLAETALNGVFDLPNQTHPYAKQSLARKVYNNLTTTSECFEVYLTVGFFEVLNPGPYYTEPAWTTPILGKEVFKDNPGDLRARFFAIVDRTNLSIDPTNTSSDGIVRTKKQGPKPVFTELAAPLSSPAIPANTGVSNPLQHTLQVQAQAGDASGLTLIYDETADQTTSYRITPGTYLRIGFGLNAEWVQVQSIGTRINTASVYHDSATGIGYLNVIRNTGVPGIHPPLVIGPPPSDGLALPVHPVGSLVTNAQLGNPGPQPNFDPNQPNYKAVMPYVQRLED
jgi:hypothetical protein